MKIKRLLLAAVAVVLMSSTAYAGGFKFGVKVGTAINKLHFDKNAAVEDLTNSKNRAGLTAGLMCEFTVPVINLGFDASVMYVHRESLKDGEGNKLNRDYIEIPLNLKYKIGLPVVSNIITPYIFTGPSFAFKTGKSEIENFVKAKKCDVAWNFGLGVELVKHLQIGASYGIGLTKTLQVAGMTEDGANIDGKNKYWTITAAYLF